MSINTLKEFASLAVYEIGLSAISFAILRYNWRATSKWILWPIALMIPAVIFLAVGPH